MSFFTDIAEKRKGFWIFIPLLSLYVFSYFQRTAVPGTVFDKLSAEGFSAADIGLIGSSFILVYSLSQLLVGMLADKFGGVRVVTIGGLLLAVSSILLPLCKTLPLICACRVVMGLGGSTMYLSLVRETDRLFGRKNFSVMLGIVYFVGYAGGLFGTLPFGRLCEMYNWRNTLLFIGVLSFIAYILFIPASRTQPLPPISKISLSFKPLIYIVKNPYSWLLLFCCSVNFGTYYIIQSVFGKKFLQDCGGFSPAIAETAMFFLTLVCMLTIMGVGTAIKIIGNRRKPMMVIANSVTLFTTCMFLATLYFKLPNVLLIIGCMLYAFASGFAMAYAMTCQELNAKDLMTTSAGFTNMGCYMFVAIGSYCVGKILDLFVDKNIADGQAISYPVEAYMASFVLLLAVVLPAFILMFFTPETKGHYLHLNSTENIK